MYTIIVYGVCVSVCCWCSRGNGFVRTCCWC